MFSKIDWAIIMDACEQRMVVPILLSKARFFSG